MKRKGGHCVPSVCRFAGITIYIYYFDHAPPHFHAVYQDMVMEVGIDPVRVLAGSLPTAKTSAVIRWAKKRRAELLANWALAQAQGGNPVPPNLIRP